LIENFGRCLSASSTVLFPSEGKKREKKKTLLSAFLIIGQKKERAQSAPAAERRTLLSLSLSKETQGEGKKKKGEESRRSVSFKLRPAQPTQLLPFPSPQAREKKEKKAPSRGDNLPAQRRHFSCPQPQREEEKKRKGKNTSGQRGSFLAHLPSACEQPLSRANKKEKRPRRLGNVKGRASFAASCYPLLEGCLKKREKKEECPRVVPMLEIRHITLGFSVVALGKRGGEAVVRFLRPRHQLSQICRFPREKETSA